MDRFQNFHNVSILQYILGFIFSSTLFTPFRFVSCISLYTSLKFITTSTITETFTPNFGYLQPLHIILTLTELQFHEKTLFLVPNFVIDVLKWVGLVGTLCTQLVLLLLDLEVFTRDPKLRQLFQEIRLAQVFVKIDKACFMAWFAYLQLSIGNFIGFGVVLYLAYKEYHSWIKARKPVPVPPLRDEEYYGILKLPLLDGRHTFGNVSLYSLFLGTIGGLGLWFSMTTNRVATVGLYLFFLSIFHQMEYVSTVMFQPANLSSFLLNHSREYHLAMVAAFTEYFLEALIYPPLKSHGWNVYMGFIVVFAAQCLRSAAMITAGSNFNHFVQSTKDENHKLVTHGVYSILRHPSYTGFFYWGVGMQIILFNPICFILNIYAITRFFKDRIPHEEETLVDFFGDDYVQYRKHTHVLIPFL